MNKVINILSLAFSVSSPSTVSELSITSSIIQKEEETIEDNDKVREMYYVSKFAIKEK